MRKLGESEEGQRWRVFPNEPVSALPGLKPGTQVRRNRDHQWEAALTKRLPPPSAVPYSPLTFHRRRPL